MKPKLNRRLAQLEENVDRPLDATLHFADGSTETIAGGWHPMELLACAVGPGARPAQRAQELEMIRNCVSIDEPGGGLILELTAAILQSPRTAAATRA